MAGRFYLLTESADYYPESGSGDWVAVYADEAEARAAFDARPLRGMSVFLIEITPPTWKTLAEK